MAVTDFFVGEIATELLKMVVKISTKSYLCKSTAAQVANSIQQLLPIIEEIKYSGVELPAHRQSQLDRFSETLRKGKELADKALHSNRLNVYKHLQLARKMEKLENEISRFINGIMQTHILADVHHMRFETTERFDRLEGTRLEQRLESMKIEVGAPAEGGWWVEEAFQRAEEEERWETNSAKIGIGLQMGKKKLKELVIGREDLTAVGISGIGGSGKTTLAREFCKEADVRSYFKEKVLFLTVSQSPDVEQLRRRIWGFVMGNDSFNPKHLTFQQGPRNSTLLVLDDVWSISDLEKLIPKINGCKTLVVSRSRFPEQVIGATYEVELLRDSEAIALFCRSAFGQESIPLTADQNLVKEVVNECKCLPLALKVIGASLKGQNEMFWACAKNKLSRGKPICESHENKVLQRMAMGIECLPNKVRECFLDLGCFPEDKKIPLDILINVWKELHDLQDEEALANLFELSEKNLLSLIEDPRAGDIHGGYYEMSVSQHDVLRDIALNFSSSENVNDCERLLMPKRDELPKEWLRKSDQPFNARIVSIHTGEMKEMDWVQMEFPKAEVLILNFSSSEHFLPPFICNMTKLRALVVVNSNATQATLSNFSVFSDLINLRSMWLEKISITTLVDVSIPLRHLMKISLVFCKIKNCLDVNLAQICPCLLELRIDHCDDLIELPSSLCELQTLRSLSVTNCHNLSQLPASLGMLKNLQILRLFACPILKALPPAISELLHLKYIDIAQCINLTSLPDEIGRLEKLEKIDMRECPQIRTLPQSVICLHSLRRVICEEEISWLWEDFKSHLPNLYIQVVDKCFDLQWLNE